MGADWPVVFAGAVTLDAIALVERFPGPDERVVAEDLGYAGGGPAATAAVAAARLGVPAAFVGTVGDDPEGRRIVEDLEAEGVDTSGVTVAAGQASGASVIVVDKQRGTRAICTRPGPSPAVSSAADLVLSAEWVHVDHLGWGPVETVLAETKVRRPRLSVDAGNPIAGFTFGGVDLYAPTVEALRRDHGDVEIDRLLDAALAAGAKAVVATDGSRGSYGATASGERCHAPGLRTEIVSTLGAGDVFHGALIAARIRELPLGESLAFANITAALSCRGLDGRSAIPTYDEVAALLPSLTWTQSQGESR
jgi:sugar/nucleoside kinase (ribokinase family)